MGRGSQITQASAQSLLFGGSSRQGTKKVRLTKAELEVKELEAAIEDHIANGGLVERGFETRFRVNGQLHREDGPAVIFPGGDQYWFRNNQLHRQDGPARILFDGTEEWWENGQRHRIGDPAIIRLDGHQEWWRNNQLHRTDGPAVVYSDRREEWWEDGQKLREG